MSLEKSSSQRDGGREAIRQQADMRVFREAHGVVSVPITQASVSKAKPPEVDCLT